MRYLADTSVWARMTERDVYHAVLPLLERGLVATCGIVDLEVLYSTRGGDDHLRVRDQRRGMGWMPMPDEVWDRAIEVQGLLARNGRHRGAALPDLLVAATAERHDATVLHYNADYDLIAEITEQPTQWVVPRGSVS